MFGFRRGAGLRGGGRQVAADEGRTALFSAAASGQQEAMRVLLDAGADTNQADETGIGCTRPPTTCTCRRCGYCSRRARRWTR